MWTRGERKRMRWMVVSGSESEFREGLVDIAPVDRSGGEEGQEGERRVNGAWLPGGKAGRRTAPAGTDHLILS